MIVFLVVGVMENAPEMDVTVTAPAFHPVYCLRSEVDVSPLALTGMKQSGLCVLRESGFEFHSTDTYSTIEDKLRVLFPKLFNWISISEPDNTDTSSWLICMKAPYSRKSLIVYSDDQSLPTGFDIITACQLSRSKVGVQNRVLYLVTRDPVPSRIAITWRPSVSSTLRLGGSSRSKLELDSESVLEIEDTDSDSAEDQSFGLPLAVNQVEDDIGVQTDEDWDKLQVAPLVNAPTPPSMLVDTIHDPFNSSLNFDDDENPWIT